MKQLVYGLFCIVFVLCGFQATYAQSVEKEIPYKLMIFGDSLSAGYRLKKSESFAAQLQNALDKAGYKQVQVINVSQSGMTTSEGLRKQPAALKQKPDAVLLELGINDVLRGLSVSQANQNLSRLIQNFQKAGISVLLAGMKAPPITEPSYARQFEQMYVNLSKKYHVLLYPFFMKGIFEAVGNQYNQATPYLQHDKAHPTNEGVALMVQDIMPTIKKFLKQQKVLPTR